MRLSLVTLLTAALGAAVAAGPALLDRVAAEVNGEMIFLSEVIEAQRSSDEPLPLAPSRHEVLNMLIDATLLEQEATQLGLEPPEGLIAEVVDEEIERIIGDWPDRHSFETWLAGRESSLPEIRQQLRESEADGWRRRTLVLGHIGTPPAELEFEPQYELSQILVECRPSASEHIVLQRYRECLAMRASAEAGVSFALMAREHSDDRRTAARGGVIGTVSLSQLDPGVAEALEGQLEGDLTLPIRTERGWLMLRVDRVISPRNQWMVHAFAEARDALVAELRERSHIVVHLEE